MTTKEQERKALEQIKKIVEGLGAGSYLEMAFEGCFEIAEENIENDWGCSLKQSLEACDKENKHLRENLETLADTNKKLSETAMAKDRLLNERAEQMKGAAETIKKLEKELEETRNTVTEYEAATKAHEETIIRLKAKLYDLITK